MEWGCHKADRRTVVEFPFTCAYLFSVMHLLLSVHNVLQVPACHVVILSLMLLSDIPKTTKIPSRVLVIEAVAHLQMENH